MAIESPYLRDGDRYERTMHGWVDAPDERHFRMGSPVRQSLYE